METYVYDNLQNISTKTRASSDGLTFVEQYSYDSLGYLKSFTDPRGDFYKTTFETDLVGQIRRSLGNSGTPQDPKPYTIEYDYDKVGNLSSVTDPRNVDFKTEYTYDADSRQLTETNALTETTTYGYDENGNLTSVTDPRGAAGDADSTTEFYFDLLDRPVGSRSPGVGAACTLLDAVGNIVGEIGAGAGLVTCSSDASPASHLTTNRYNALGWLESSTDPEGNTTTWSDFDGLGNPQTITDKRGFVTQLEYDGLEYVRTIKRQAGPSGEQTVTETFVYDSLGNLRESTDARGPEYKTTYTYDGRYRLIETTQDLVYGDGGTLVTKITYDQVGNVLSTTDPRGDFYQQQFAYDAGNRVVRIEQPTGTAEQPGDLAVFTRVYDLAGNLIESGDSRGQDYSIKQEYDAAGRLSKIIEPTGTAAARGADAVTELFYDAAGNAERIVHPRTNEAGEKFESKFDYNGRNTLNFEIDADGNRTNYDYFDSGEIRNIEQPGDEHSDTRITTFEYDELDRVRFERLDGHTIETRYDAAGNLTLVSGPFADVSGKPATTTTQYDALGFLISTTDPEDNTTTYKRDAVGNAIEVIDARGDYYKSSFEYDAAKRLRKQIDPTGNPLQPSNPVSGEFEFDGAGNLTKSIDPRGEDFATLYTYDALGFLTKIDRAGGTTAEIERSIEEFTNDIVGNQVRIVDPRGEAFAQTLTYDLVGRLASVTYPSDASPGPRTERFEYDAGGNVIKHFTLASDGAVTEFSYDGLDRQTKIVNAVGETITTQYDRFGNETIVTDYLGTTQSRYDRFDRLVRYTDASGVVETTNYQGGDSIIVTRRDDTQISRIIVDQLGRIIENRDAGGAIDRVEFDKVGNVIAEVDRRGTRTEYAYDARNVPLSVTEAVATPVERTTTITYDELGRQQTQVDPRGEFFTTTFVYDNLSRLTERQLPSGTPDSPGINTPGFDSLVHQYRYTPTGNVAYEIPSGGDDYRIDYQYDARDNLKSRTYKIGTSDASEEITETFVHDTAGRLVEYTDATGFTTSQTFDDIDRLLTQKIGTESGGTIDYSWDYINNELGTLVTRFGPGDVIIESTQYDKLGRIATQTSRGSQPVSYVYNDLGHVESETIGSLTTTFEYDDHGYPKKQTDPEGHATTLVFDAEGNMLLRQLPGIGSASVWNYDALGRLEKKTTPEGSETLFGYDESNFIQSVTDASGAVVTYQKDLTGRIWKETSTFGSRTFRYDAAGNPIEQVDRLGRKTTRAFNTRDQVVTENWFDADGNHTDTLSFVYTTDGQLSSAIHGDSTLQRSYTEDGLRLVAGEITNQIPTVSPHTMTIGYDALQQRETLGFSNVDGEIFTNTYSYADALGRLSEISQTGPSVTDKSVNWTYEDGLDLPSTITRSTSATGSTAVVSTFEYDGRGFIDTLTHSGAGSTLNLYRYTFDPAGRIERREDSFDTAIFAYDDAGQVESVAHTQDAFRNEFYEYTVDGRRDFSHLQIGTFTYEDHNRLTFDGNRLYVHDDEGNLVEMTVNATGEKTSFEYDNRNRLLKTTDFDTAGSLVKTVSFEYDALDRRIEISTDTTAIEGGEVTTKWFVYDGQSIVLEYAATDSNAPSLEAVNLHSENIDEVLAVDNAEGQTLWLLPDDAGTIRDVAKADGTLANHIALDSFGNVVEQTDSDFAVRFLLAGRELDDQTGLYYLRARYLDPQTGMFISEDPLGPVQGDINSFRYAFNSPITLDDPTGLSPLAQPHPWSSAYVGTRSESTGLQLTLEALFVLPEVGFQTIQELAGLVVDPALVLAQLPFVAAFSNSTDFVTIGSYWESYYNGDETLSALAPLAIGLGAGLVGAAAGFAVGGPAGASAGFLATSSLFGAGLGVRDVIQGYSDQDPRRIAAGFIGIGLSAAPVRVGYKGLRTARANLPNDFTVAGSLRDYGSKIRNKFTKYRKDTVASRPAIDEFAPSGIGNLTRKEIDDAIKLSAEFDEPILFTGSAVEGRRRGLGSGKPFKTELSAAEKKGLPQSELKDITRSDVDIALNSTNPEIVQKLLKRFKDFDGDVINRSLAHGARQDKQAVFLQVSPDGSLTIFPAVQPKGLSGKVPKVPIAREIAEEAGFFSKLVERKTREGFPSVESLVKQRLAAKNGVPQASPNVKVGDTNLNPGKTASVVGNSGVKPANRSATPPTNTTVNRGEPTSGSGGQPNRSQRTRALQRNVVLFEKEFFRLESRINSLITDSRSRFSSNVIKGAKEIAERGGVSVVSGPARVALGPAEVLGNHLGNLYAQRVTIAKRLTNTRQLISREELTLRNIRSGQTPAQYFAAQEQEILSQIPRSTPKGISSSLARTRAALNDTLRNFEATQFQLDRIAKSDINSIINKKFVQSVDDVDPLIIAEFFGNDPSALRRHFSPLNEAEIDLPPCDCRTRSDQSTAWIRSGVLAYQ